MTSEWVDGLPPVGCECDVLVEMSETHKLNLINVEITYKGKGLIVFIDGDEEYCYPYDEVKFRPVEADIERNTAIDEMIGCLGDYFVGRGDLEVLHDAGYRIPPEQGEVVSAAEVYQDWREGSVGINAVLKKYNITRRVK